MFKYSHPTNGKFRQFVRKTDTVTSHKSRKLFGKDFILRKNKSKQKSKQHRQSINKDDKKYIK